MIHVRTAFPKKAQAPGARMTLSANAMIRETIGTEYIDKKGNGGRYWARTSDPSDVNTVLYQLS